MTFIPQMAPINWTFLFLMFLLTNLMFNIINYYIYSPKINKSTSKIKMILPLNWKW
uniref:ATP synthase complex subunit 8 n=1 Tax=Culicoides cylindratus TaxID=469760 RepID=A8B0U3_9DIPT|nr:ATP synthase F0 subunit 8 [Culicoides cylindratus]BAF80304.1 ATP synthase F0 subunit 8 [Culicoides cylindratus]